MACARTSQFVWYVNPEKSSELFWLEWKLRQELLRATSADMRLSLLSGPLRALHECKGSRPQSFVGAESPGFSA